MIHRRLRTTRTVFSSRQLYRLPVLLLLLATSCQSGYRREADRMIQLEMQGDFVGAASLARENAANSSERDQLLWLLEAGRTAQIAGDTSESLQAFDRAQALVRPYLDTEAEARITEAIVTTLVNQTFAIYHGTPFERIMLAALQGMNRLQVGAFAEARVELNLARDWQDDAIAKAADEIEAAEKEAQDQFDATDSLAIPTQLRESLATLGDRTAYADWQNPFASWLRAISRIASAIDDGDLDDARFDLRAVATMQPDAAALVAPDIQAIESRQLEPTTWVLLMSGLAPELDQFRLDIPVPFGSGYYVSAAFPVLKVRDEVALGLQVEVDGTQSEGVLLANINAMSAADYERRLPLIVLQEVMSAAVKTVGTWAVSRSAGDARGLVQLVGIIAQATTTAADRRSWRTLPAHIEAARLPTPATGLITIRTREGHLLGTAQVESGAWNLVVVTVVGNGSASSTAHAGLQSFKVGPGPTSQ